jgi:hypothetical protein
MRFAVSYSYVLATSQNTQGEPTEIGGRVPITLVPNVLFDATADWDWTNPNSVVSQIYSVIQAWDTPPLSRPGSSYVIDLTIFASGGNLQPLIRATTLRWMIPTT